MAAVIYGWLLVVEIGSKENSGMHTRNSNITSRLWWPELQDHNMTVEREILLKKEEEIKKKLQ